MTRFDTFYSIIIGLLRNLTNSVGATAYYDLLPSNLKERFVSLTDPINEFIIELQKKRRRQEIFGDFDSIKQAIEQFSFEFSNFPNFRIDQILTSIAICKRVSDLVDNTKIKPSNFVLIPLQEKTKPHNYIFFRRSINDSALVFSIKNVTGEESGIFESFLEGIPERQALILFYLLSKLGGKSNLDKGQYIFVHKSFKNSSNKILSFLKLCSVCDGDVIHTPYEIQRRPQIIDRESLSLQKTYSQFVDSIDILSEYNYEKDILNKYLRLYHVVENFMFKIPIVDLMSTSNGNMFSIRSFKNLYTRVDKTESVALTDFMKVIFSMAKIGGSSSGGTTFSQSISSLWQSLSSLPDFNSPKFNEFLKEFKITNSGSSLVAMTVDLYCKLIYQMRNSIVHNKETEYHILHNTLNPIVPFLLLNFLFPSLEEICFKLIIETDSKVTYTSPNLKLYVE